MNQQTFKKELLTTKIFQEEKDKAIVSIKHLKCMYLDYEDIIDFKKIYVDIINYQIKKYGRQLADPKQVEYFYLKYQASRGHQWRKKL